MNERQKKWLEDSIEYYKSLLTDTDRTDQESLKGSIHALEITLKVFKRNILNNWGGHKCQKS